MIDFVKNKKIYFTISIALVVVTLLVALIWGLEVDIQFKGGTIITYSYENELDMDAVGNLIEDKIGRVSLQQSKDNVTGSDNLVVSLAANKGIGAEVLDDLNIALAEEFELDYVESNTVDPNIGFEFFLKCLVAVAVASVLMILYIAFRFKKISGWSAGVMAVVALLHDVFVVFATFVLFGIPIDVNFMAVVLTILGYSVNDTIVIYDRIRENKKLYGRTMTTAELVNKSTNQCLTRTINTTISTVVALIVICIVALCFNLSSIISFAFPMIIGMISGVYSTLCIATPLWVVWQNHKERKKAAKA